MPNTQVHIKGGGRFNPVAAYNVWKHDGDALFFTAGRRWVTQHGDAYKRITKVAARNWLTRRGIELPRRLRTKQPKLDAQMLVNCYKHQLVNWHKASKAAGANGMSLSDWVRDSLDAAAEKQLK